MQKIDMKHNIDFKLTEFYWQDFIEYSNDMQDVYKCIEECNLGKKSKILIVFDDMIVDMINNKNLNPVVIELFIISRKLNILIVFIP